VKWKMILLAILCYGNRSASAQKPLIDNSVYGKWPRVELNYGTVISNDGRFMSYIVEGDEGISNRIVRSVQQGWQVKWSSKLIEFEFSQNSQKYIFSRGDSVGIGILGSSYVSYIPGANLFRLIKEGIDDDWLIYSLKTEPDKLIFRDLRNNEEQTCSSVQDFWYSESQKDFVVQTKDKQGKEVVQIFSIADFRPQSIWYGKLFGAPVWDKVGSSFAFAGVAQGDSINAIYYYQKGANIAEKLVDKNNNDLGGNYDVMRPEALCNNNNSVLFTVREKAFVSGGIEKDKSVAIDIYNYKDAKLQSEQLRTAKQLTNYHVIYNKNSKRIVWIEKKRERVLWQNGIQINDNHVLIDKIDHLDSNGEAADYREWSWNPHAKHSFEILDVNNGKISRLCSRLQHIQGLVNVCQFSPDGKYVLWYDYFLKNYFSYDVATGRICNLTKKIATNWSLYDPQGDCDEPEDRFHPVGIAGFLPDEKSVLLYDLHDIYQVDLSGLKTPICLTNYEGRRKNLRFRLAMYTGDIPERSILKEKNHDPVLVNAFDLKAKKDGFYQIQLGYQKLPNYLSMQSKLFDGLREYESVLHTPIKARDANIYIVQCESETQSPNLFSTYDFKSFLQITDLNPQKKYNWLTSELITWKTFNNSTSQGILYKPENFDPKKKYPIIFFYYEKFSNTLHRFLEPEANGATIDIPTFVSNGYLVFVPDIHYPLNTGQGYGCYNSVVSAAKYLSKMPWVDAKHMAINGHSRGGFQTNYLVTHTNLFAAAISGAGYSDAINLYSRIWEYNGSTRQSAYEVGHQRMGGTPWQRPDLYKDGSPILKANKVTTPVLMMNNIRDPDIPFEQGAEFFTALRRLGKKAGSNKTCGQAFDQHVWPHNLVDGSKAVVAGNDYSCVILLFTFLNSF